MNLTDKSITWATPNGTVSGDWDSREGGVRGGTVGSSLLVTFHTIAGGVSPLLQR